MFQYSYRNCKWISFNSLINWAVVLWHCLWDNPYVPIMSNDRRTDLTDLRPLQNSDQWSQLLTREEREEGEKKGQVLPRQQRPCVKHSRHGVWRVSVCRNELHLSASLCVTVSLTRKEFEDSSSARPGCAWRAPGIYSIWLFCVIARLKVYHVLVFHTQTVCCVC